MLIQEPAGDAAVSVDAAVAQEWPVLTGNFYFLAVKIGVEDLFAVMGGLSKDAPERVRYERSSPELKAGGGGVVARAFDKHTFVLHISMLMPYPVDGADEDAVGNRVGTLDGLPGVVLALAELSLFRSGASRSRWERRAFPRL